METVVTTEKLPIVIVIIVTCISRVGFFKFLLMHLYRAILGHQTQEIQQRSIYDHI